MYYRSESFLYLASSVSNDETDEAFFRNWGIEKSKCYLLEREILVGNTNKGGLISLCVFANILGLRVVKDV